MLRAGRSLTRTRLLIRTFRTMAVLKGKPEAAKFLNSRPAQPGECKWIGLEKLTFQDPNGQQREWDSAVRMTRSSGGVDAIGMLTILKYPDSRSDEVVLQKQFRPPVGGVCIEMPAGLIDANETIEEAATRELQEETGYVGKIVSKTPIIFNDPGFSNTNLSLLTVEVDMSLPENINPQSKLEENEFIECFNVPLKDFAQKMVELDSQGYKLDARIQNVAEGIKVAQQYKL